jgi:hypothetical protein
MTGIALLVLVIVILAALTDDPTTTPAVVVMPQVQTATRGNRAAVFFLVFLFLAVLFAEMVRRGG